MTKTDRQERSLNCLDIAAQYLSYQEKQGAEYSIFFYIALSELVSEQFPALAPDQLPYFRYVLCKNDGVLLVSEPCWRVSDGKPISQETLDSLRNCGLPLLSDCCGDLLDREDIAGGWPSLLKAMNSSGIWKALSSPPAWRYPSVVIPQELFPVLEGKGLIQPGKTCSIPSTYGNDHGLRGMLGPYRWEGDQVTVPRGLCCSRDCWQRLWEQQDSSPEWEKLPLDVRLERIEKWGGANLGHFTFNVRQLMNMSLKTYLEQPYQRVPTKQMEGIRDQSKQYAQDKLGDLSLTFGQAVQRVLELLASPGTQQQGQQLIDYIMDTITVLYIMDQNQKGIKE